MKVFNCYNSENLREIFVNTVVNVFGAENKFLDFCENINYNSGRYDVFVCYDDESYIIDRQTGYYVNWYKFTHIGRDFHTNMSPKLLISFLESFKEV